MGGEICGRNASWNTCCQRLLYTWHTRWSFYLLQISFWYVNLLLPVDFFRSYGVVQQIAYLHFHINPNHDNAKYSNPKYCLTSTYLSCGLGFFLKIYLHLSSGPTWWWNRTGWELWWALANGHGFQHFGACSSWSYQWHGWHYFQLFQEQPPLEHCWICFKSCIEWQCKGCWPGWSRWNFFPGHWIRTTTTTVAAIWSGAYWSRSPKTTTAGDRGRKRARNS